MKKGLSILAGIALWATGCAERGMFEDIHVRPDVSLPIGRVVASDSALFALADLDGKMAVGEDGVLMFVDSTELALSKPGVGTSLVEVPVQNFGLYKLIPASLPVVGGFVELPEGQVTETFAMTGLNGTEVDTVVFRTGSFVVRVEGLEGVTGYDPRELRIEVPNLLRDEQPVVLTAGVPVALGPEYKLVPDAGNRIRVRFSGRVPRMAALDGEVAVYGGEIDYVAGWFGRKEISRVSRVIEVEGMGEFAQNAEYIRFDRPEVVFLLKNEYNAPLMAEIESLQANGVAVELKPGRAGQLVWVAPRAVTRVVLGNEQTLSENGLTEALTKDFAELSVEVRTLLNPTARDLKDPFYEAPTHNSMYAQDTLGGAFLIGIPMEGVMDRVVFDQELEVDLSGLDKEKISYENLTLALSGTNGMPLGLSITVAVEDTVNGVSTLLFDDPVRFPSSENNLAPDDPGFKPGVVDGSNLIVRSLSAERIDRLLEADKLTLRLTATTLGAEERQAVKIYSPSELNLHIVAGAKLDYTIGGK